MLEQIIKQWTERKIFSIPLEEWLLIEGQFQILSRHDTHFAGELLLIQSASGFAVVEQDTPTSRVIRPLATPEEAKQFIAGRLDQYDRMWDGCGCKIDYYR